MGRYKAIRQLIATVKAIANDGPKINAAAFDISSRGKTLSYAVTDEGKDIVKRLYRSNAKIGNGSTADAVRYEKASGVLLSPAGHEIKAKECINRIDKILRKTLIILTKCCLYIYGKIWPKH